MYIYIYNFLERLKSQPDEKVEKITEPEKIMKGIFILECRMQTLLDDQNY